MRFPSSRLGDPMAAPALRWGVLGTGWIAERFTASLRRHTRQQVVAVGSRTVAAAKDFAGRTGIGRAHGSYEELVADPGVDVVYVATPHNYHHSHALLAIDAGKHVLIEKPIALNAAEARDIAARASARGVFCAEALWTFFLPSYDVIRQLLDDGVLGDVRTVLADHGEWFPATHRIMRHELAGGALLDMGTYPIALAGWVLGAPASVTAIGQDVPGGEVHGQVSAVLRHHGGAQSALNTTIMADTPCRAVIAGTAGTLTTDGPFLFPGDLTLTARGETAHYSEPAIGHDGLFVTAVEASRRISAGETGTPVRPLGDSIATLETIDEIRRQLGVTFLEESAPGVPA